MKTYKITESAVRTRVGSRSFSRGKRYYAEGSIASPWHHENALRARCWGSLPQPYQVWVQLGPEGIEDGECSCPVGDGGYCKHVAALLLTWLHEPDGFEEVEPIEKALDQREKADLIQLIRQMIARYPDLEEMIHLKPAGDSNPEVPANPDFIRGQVDQALQHGDYGHAYYGAVATIAHELQIIMQQAKGHQQQGEWVNTAVIYCTVLDQLRAQHAEIYDRDGDLSVVYGIGSERLGECLAQIRQPEARLDILRTLVGIVCEAINAGGYGFADTAYDVVLNQATSAEKIEVVTWVESELREIKSLEEFGDKWRAQAYGRFLLELQTDSLTDEQYIQLCRRTGQVGKVVERLLQLGRFDEAIPDAKAASDYELLSLADLFVTHDQYDIAEALVWERTATSTDTRLDGWLKQQALKKGDWRRAITYAENQFWPHSDIERYREMRDIARKLGDWPERRQRVLSRLTQQKDYALVTRIHILEKDLDAALETLTKVRFGGDLGMEVANAAEKTRPHEAVRLYQQKVDRLIAARGRDNYAQAAVYLTRVKRLYKKLRETEAWKVYIEVVRNQKPRLPALLDELKQAGL